MLIFFYCRNTYINENQEKEPEQLTYDGHEGVEVADVEALAGHIDEELDDSGSVFLLHRLQDDIKGNASLRRETRLFLTECNILKAGSPPGF